MSKNHNSWKRLIKIIVLLGVLVLLEFFPGRYTIDSFQDEWTADSPEGIALLALAGLELNTVMTFDRATRQRFSRNAELIIPAGSTITLNASMVPGIEDGEAIAKPRTWELTSNTTMTFIYRGVSVARAKRMHIQSDDPELRVQAVGSYSLLSALATAHRYHRQKEIKRSFQAPDRALLHLDATFLANHSIPVSQTTTLTSGTEPGRLHIRNLIWEQSQWTDGNIDLSISITSLEPFLNDLASDLISEPFELGNILALKFRKLHALTIEENRLFVHLDGSITSANSSTVEQVFDPSFETRLEFEFEFPEGQTLQEAEIGAGLRQLHSFDINRSNILFDKAVRNLARRYRDKLRFRYRLVQDLPEHPAIPKNLYFERFGFTGSEDKEVLFEIHATVGSLKQENSSL